MFYRCICFVNLTQSVPCNSLGTSRDIGLNTNATQPALSTVSVWHDQASPYILLFCHS